MSKTIIILCALCLVIIEGRPRWQYLPEVPGYVPVYIRNGDTPLEEINPDLAEAFHALPSGRSAGKEVEASIEPEQDILELPIQIKNYPDKYQEKKVLEKKKKYENKPERR